MTSEPIRRRLLAVMFTDIEGYSKIMNADETLALEILHFHNSFLHETIERNEGRVVEIIGDAFLAVFDSAVHALEVGIAIQEGLRRHNEKLSERERFLVRIGIHIGDIIEETSGVKGDAVNIAARIQSFSPGGGIAISETIYNAVKSRMPLDVIFLGSKKLKNIQEPYKIYSVTPLATKKKHSKTVHIPIYRKFSGRVTSKKLVIPFTALLIIILSYFYFFKKDKFVSYREQFPAISSESYNNFQIALNIYQHHKIQNYTYALDLLDGIIANDSSFTDASALIEMISTEMANNAKKYKNRSIHTGTFWQIEYGD